MACELLSGIDDDALSLLTKHAGQSQRLLFVIPPGLYYSTGFPTTAGSHSAIKYYSFQKATEKRTEAVQNESKANYQPDAKIPRCDSPPE